MARAVGSSFKVDVAIPTEIYEVVVKMAEDADAPIHHKSGQRILTPSILQLLRIGIRSLADNPELADTSIFGLSNAPDPRVSELLNRVRMLEERSPDDVQTAIDEAIAPIQLDLAELLGQIDQLRVSIEEIKATDSG